MADLKLNKVSKIFDGGVKAVDEFTLDIDDKEFLVLVGPSGCGKSTTLRMIAGLEEITEGGLYIDEKCVNDIPSKDRNIAMVFQDYALYPHMTVFQNMSFALKLRKVPKDEIKKRVEETAKILSIENLLNRKPKALSGGQRQRVALGRAIVRSPKVFLMDEPLSNLDAKLRVQMRKEISILHKNLQTTFVYVTHDQTEAMTMGTRIVVMKDGIIHQVDTPKNIYNMPKNMFVASFIGSPQMNFLKAKVSVSNGNYYLLFNNNRILLSDEKGSYLISEGYENKEIIFGIRPENIYYIEKNQKKNFNNVIKVKVDVIELMGSESYIYTSLDKDNLTIKSQTDVDFHANDEINISFDLNKLHIFDEDTEKVILN